MVNKKLLELVGKVEPPISQPISETTTLPLDQILLRNQNTRPLNQQHIQALADSIAALGLIQPIAVDTKGRLLAGGHRRAAIEYLKESNPEAYEQHFRKGVSIRRYDFDAEKEAELALAIEATENEKRRDYTATEVRELAERLKSAGFHHTRGRAKAGQKSLAPTLAVIVGKSTRTIERYLAGDSELNPTDDGFRKQLELAIKAMRKLHATPPQSGTQKKLVKELAEMIARLEQGME